LEIFREDERTGEIQRVGHVQHPLPPEREEVNKKQRREGERGREFREEEG